MRMSNSENAVVEIDKLTEYCLKPVHPRGQHRARVFESALGITDSNVELLRNALLKAVAGDDIVMSERDEHGQRFVVLFEMIGPVGNATVRSAWIIRAGEDFPRFVSCDVL